MEDCAVVGEVALQELYLGHRHQLLRHQVLANQRGVRSQPPITAHLVQGPDTGPVTPRARLLANERGVLRSRDPLSTNHSPPGSAPSPPRPCPRSCRPWCGSRAARTAARRTRGRRRGSLSSAPRSPRCSRCLAPAGVIQQQ